MKSGERLIKKIIYTITILAFISMSLPIKAASLTNFEDNLSRLQTSTLANHTIKFVVPTGLTSGANITVAFDADFVMGTFALVNVDIATASTCNGSFTDKNLITGIPPPTGNDWKVSQSGNNIIISLGDTASVTAGHCISIEIGSNATSGGTGSVQITNPSGAQTATLAISTSTGDSGTAGIAIVTGDQVNITATVDPTISFAVSDSTIGYGTLSSGSARWATGDTLGSGSSTSAHDLTASTNAAGGYTIYVLGDTLTSGVNTISAIGGSATASTPGTEQFGFKVSASGGSGTAVAPYASADYAYNATASTQDDIAASTVPSTTTTFSLTYIGNISATTEAGSYATTLTYTATGNF